MSLNWEVWQQLWNNEQAHTTLILFLYASTAL